MNQLVAVEGSFVLADDDRVEPPRRASDRGQQRCGLRALAPGKTAGAADVEVLGDNVATTGDRLVRRVDLPGS